jgi:hypothetical protein
MTNKEQCKEIARLIREGSSKTLQCYSTFYMRSKSDEYTCAVGALMYAKNESSFTIEVIDKIILEFPVLSGIMEANHKCATLFSEIAYRNDIKGQSREEIADWIESLEWKDEVYI